MAIFIFKTNINKRLLKSTAQIFDVKDDIERWAVDLEDIDKVLRIKSTCNNPTILVEKLAKIGVKCQELT
jgi:uncharacterized membrane protein